MRNRILFYIIALILTLPVCGFGQTVQSGQIVPVAPTMLLNVGGLKADAYGSYIKLDAQGNTYVIGSFRDPEKTVDFDPSAGVTNLDLNSSNFIAKYSAAGALVWVKPFSGEGNGLDLDRNGNLTVVGTRASPNPPNRFNRYLDAFIIHFDNNGNLLWQKLIKSGSKNLPIDPTGQTVPQDAQTGYKVTSDDAGNLIAVFKFGGSPDVDGIITAKGTYDGLVVKYDPNGNVIWKFNLGSAGAYTNTALETFVDKNNNIIVAGYTDGTVNYNPLGTPVNVTKSYTVFLAKYSPAGILQWVKTVTTNASKNNIRLALDGQDNIYLYGSTLTTVDFGVAPTITPPSRSQDIFIAKYSSGGNLLYHKTIGGLGATALNAGLATGPDNSLYLTGKFTGTVDVDMSASVHQLTSEETVGMFLAKYDKNCNIQWAFGIPNIFGASSPVVDLNFAGDLLKIGAEDISVNTNDEIAITGAFVSTVNFNGTGCGINSLTSTNADHFDHNVAGLNDMFIVRYSPSTEIPVRNNTVTPPVATGICPNVNPDVITGSIPISNNYTYQWQQSSDSRNYTDIPNAVSKDFRPPIVTATIYYRRKVITTSCALASMSNVIKLTLLKAATLNTITAPATSRFCYAGDAVLIRGSVPQADGTIYYQWQQSTDNVNFTNINGATAKEFDPTSVTVTTYYRRLITNSPCNIGTPSNTVTITVISMPAPTISAQQTVCIGNGVMLNATGGIGYSWSPATGLSATDIASPTAKPTATTNYTVTISNGNCSSTLQVKVIVVSKPTVNAGDDKELLKGNKLQLNPQVTNVEGATYSWTPTTFLNNPAIANPTASPPDNITYRLTVKSANGCFTVSDDITINVREKLVMPNAFTPNGDGINDVLAIPGLNAFPSSSFTIFNRNGQPIFKSTAYSKPWDGTHDGKPLPTGTYYYVIELNNNAQKRISGYISLMK